MGVLGSFGIPAGRTCPGKTLRCETACYALRGRYNTKTNKAIRQRKLAATKRKSFVARMVAEINQGKVSVVRIHDSGDFYDVSYIKKWIKIAKACPGVRFFTYTRSWRLPSLVPSLRDFSLLRNVRLWLSTDIETGPPVFVSKRCRVAYMQSEEGDLPKFTADLAFRVHKLRKKVVKRIGSNGILVCPPENGVTNTTCIQCKMCWNPASDPKSKRRPLPVI